MRLKSGPQKTTPWNWRMRRNRVRPLTAQAEHAAVRSPRFG